MYFSPITGTKIKPTPKAIRWHEPLSQEEDSADEYETPAQSTFNPKKRWLREAWQNELAKPLEPITNGQYDMHNKSNNKLSTSYQQMLSPPKQPFIPHQYDNIEKVTNQMNPNQLRPTVLMVASKDKTMPLVNQPTSTNIVNSNIAATYLISSPQPLQTTISKNNCIDSQPKGKNHVVDSDIHIERNNVIASTPIVSSQHTTNTTNTLKSQNHQTVDGKNRKWMGALALMELATDENNPVSSSLPLVHRNSSTN